MAVRNRLELEFGKSASFLQSSRGTRARQAFDPPCSASWKCGSAIQLDLREKIHSAESQEARRRIADLQQTIGANAPVRVAVGSVKEALLNAALESDADVLIIGRSHQAGAHGRMRDLTYAIVRDSPFPVLSV
jgi:nucleotide-binding universal stress UspA family protein